MTRSTTYASGPSRSGHHELAPGNEPWDSIAEQMLAGTELLQPGYQQLKG